MNATVDKKKKSLFDKYPIVMGSIITLIIILLVDFLAALILIKPTDKAVLRFRSRMGHGYYHHDLMPNLQTKDVWGNVVYDLTTNELGFRSNQTGPVPMESDKYRLVIIGDSFTEGVGVNYDSTFVALLARKYPELDILNAGIVSYSPKLYYLKTKYLLEEKQMKFNELLTCIDISDIQDEVDYAYFAPSEGTYTLRQMIWGRMQNHLIRNSFFANFYYKMKYFVLKEEQIAWFNVRGKWGLDEDVYQEWGAKGIASAQLYMDSLHQLCQTNAIKLSIAIHPWPIQVREHALHGKEVSIWEDFSQERDIKLVNHFPSFVDSVRVDTSAFIPGDIHWNAKGHEIIANKIIRENFLPDSTNYSQYLQKIASQ